MNHHHHDLPQHFPLPKLADLGDDLLLTTPAQRWLALARPFIGIMIYALAAHLGLWLLAPLIVFLIFVAVVTVTHDVVHGTLGLSKRSTEWALFLTGAALLESGHAYRTTHHQHHSVFPHPDDPEGDPARMSFWQAVIHGPLFLPRLWLWAFRRNKNRPDQRRWMLLEAAWTWMVIAAGFILWEQTPAILIYAAMVIAGSWVYPLRIHPSHRRQAQPFRQITGLRMPHGCSSRAGRVGPVMISD